MKKSDFHFILPQELIAQEPKKNRDESRLLVIHRNNDSIEHKQFFHLIDYLNKGDVLVLNDSKVIPARIFFLSDTKKSVEILLIRQLSEDTWVTYVSPGKRARKGQELHHISGKLFAKVIEVNEDGERIVQFKWDLSIPFILLLNAVGTTPIPPYIKTDSDRWKNEYQTVYAVHNGSVAAPTAGLHFTDTLLESIQKKGIQIAKITLHVGPGTFKPVKTELLENHKMSFEFFEINDESAKLINQCKQKGGRCIAVGTTVTRALEGSVENGKVVSAKQNTNLFITPGYTFKVIDGLVTNFHLPESTLIMLVSAFYDREKLLASYQIAIQEKYKFYSFGDAMLLI